MGGILVARELVRLPGLGGCSRWSRWPRWAVSVCLFPSLADRNQLAAQEMTGIVWCGAAIIKALWQFWHCDWDWPRDCFFPPAAPYLSLSVFHPTRREMAHERRIRCVREPEANNGYCCRKPDRKWLVKGGRAEAGDGPKVVRNKRVGGGASVD